MLGHILARSRYFIIIAIIGTFLASIMVIIYGGLTVVNIFLTTFIHLAFTSDSLRHFAVECIEIIDLFLLGTVLYIMALGLYDLFIDDRLPMPSWLVIHSLDSLKERLLGVIVVLLAVAFLGNVITWDGSTHLLELGIATALILFALGFLLRPGILSERHRQPAAIDNTAAQSESSDAVNATDAGPPRSWL